MRYKYDRLTKVEKKNLFLEYKGNKPELVKKMNRMKLFCIIGIIYSIIVFLYDFLVFKERLNIFLDVIVFVICVGALIKLLHTKKNLLNNYLLNKDKDRKNKILEKYTKK